MNNGLAGSGSGFLVSVNPATGKALQQIAADNDAAVERKLALAADTFGTYRRSSFADRARWMQRLADLLESDKAGLARTMTLEMGKPLRAAIQECEKCATACRYYAENAERFLADESLALGSASAVVRYQPLGPVLAVMPWNFPFWQVFRFAAPALMAGNVGLLKHASNVPQCALAIEALFTRAGFPAGAFQALLIGSSRTSQVIADRRVRAVTLTGSVAAGSQVAAVAGREIKKTVLELGGSDPFIVMPSANLERAVATAVQARTINNGQSCIAAKRFIIDERIAEAFEARFVRQMAALRVGDPLEETTDIGPLATEEVLNSLAEQVERTARMGARVLLGGARLKGAGFFYPPTVLGQVPAGSPAYEEELFGPVASLFRVDGIGEALRLANDTPFGLGAALWTNEPRERELFIEEMESGLAVINGMVASDARVPFGGLKQSGYGRELSHQGIREFVNIKTVVSHQVPR
jgi:succinate-semialdehyde dehydrogenase/glutarate-semialdehyde dehydrogenase